MLQIDMKTEQGGVKVHWSKDDKGGFLKFTRRDGSPILRIHANYADARALETAAKVLNFLFRGQNNNSEEVRNNDK